MSLNFSGLNKSTLRTFGEPVTYYPTEGAPVSLTGVVRQSSRPEESIPGNVTRLFVQLSDFSIEPSRQEIVTVRGDDYVITDVRGDDAGGLELLIRKN